MPIVVMKRVMPVEQRGTTSVNVFEEGRKFRLAKDLQMNRVRTLQRKLYKEAKQVSPANALFLLYAQFLVISPQTV